MRIEPALCAGILILATALRTGSTVRTSSLGFQRGVNFTAEQPLGYTEEVARPTLERLRGYGVNAVALVPYGFAPRNRPVVRFGGGAWERDDRIEATARVAHELRFKVLLKPQLWVRPGSPGDLDFASEADRDEWFRQYQLYIEHQAQLATKIHADLFCIGVEFVKLTRFEQPWRRIIARTRELYTGPITYGASQGPEFKQIRFWDALDYIGLNDYYPLPDDLSAAAIAAVVERVQKRYNRPVLFTEVGFSSYQAPNRAPWDETPRALSPADQARCYEAVFRAFYMKSWFEGMYWWKVGTDGGGGPQDGSHTPWGKPAMEVVKKWYTSGRR